MDIARTCIHPLNGPATAGEIADNVADADGIRALARDFAGVLDLPLGARYSYDWVADVVGNVGQLDLLVDLAEEYAEAKRRQVLRSMSTATQSTHSACAARSPRVDRSENGTPTPTLMAAM